MFFDNAKYFEFVNRCRAAGITVPIIPGLKPLTSLTQQTLLPKTFHIDLPMELATELTKCKSNDEVKALGIEWGIPADKILLSGKDMNHPLFRDFDSPFSYSDNLYPEFE